MPHNETKAHHCIDFSACSHGGDIPHVESTAAPDIWLQHWIEKSTSLGSGYADVEATVIQRGWFRYRGQNASDGDWRFPNTYIRGELGEYQGLPFRTSVTAFWEFDESNRLTNIRIWRTRDAP
jgi:hypothetical protein